MAELVNQQQRINPLTIALDQFDRTAEILHLDEDMRKVLRVPKRELTVNFPVRMDTGSLEMFSGYRVQPQRESRPGQGRHSIRPRRGHRGSARPGDVDDVEVCFSRHSLRWRERRRRLQSKAALPH